MDELGGIARQARKTRVYYRREQTRRAFCGVLLVKTHGSTERFQRREQTGFNC